MDEEFVPGAYTALEKINIRTQMKTSPTMNIVGGFTVGEPFTVYEVYAEKDGIVWGRISSNVGGGQERFVGLRVNNHPKVKLEKAFEGEHPKPSNEWAAAMDAWARSKGYSGPGPG